MSKDQPNFSKENKADNHFTPPVDQNPLVAELKQTLIARETIISQQNELIADLDSQIEKFSKRPDIVAKLQSKLAVFNEVSAQKLEKLNNFLIENQTTLLATSLVGLSGVAGLQAQSINSLQQQLEINSNNFELQRRTDEKTFDSIQTREAKRQEEFDDKIQKLQQEMQELKSKQSSTLLPQTNPTSSENLQEFNQKIPASVLPGFTDWEKKDTNTKPTIPNITLPKSESPEFKPPIQPPVSTPPASVPMSTPNSPTEGMLKE